ncbi:MAG: two-component system response regulator, partial [Alphaproteobacteria bacterium]|nr:two-component system response regulator [Alphaproteobacteria bacterium]
MVSERGTDAPIEPRRLLLVDDDDAFRRRLCQALKRRGYEGTVASRVVEACEMASAVKPEFAD